jgi:hypothetical protein
VTPAIATVILENFRLCMNGLRCNLWRAGTNHLWSGALCARLPPGGTTGRWLNARPGQRRADVTQVQGDTSLGATITHAGCCLLVIVPVTWGQLRRN